MRHGPLVPANWAASVRPIVTGYYTDTVTIERRDGYTTDALGTEVENWVQLASGVPGLVESMTTWMPSTGDTVGQPFSASQYRGRFPFGTDLDVGDRVTVTASPDPESVGVYSVSGVLSEGHVVDRSARLDRVGPNPGGA